MEPLKLPPFPAPDVFSHRAEVGRNRGKRKLSPTAIFFPRPQGCLAAAMSGLSRMERTIIWLSGRMEQRPPCGGDVGSRRKRLCLAAFGIGR